MSSTIQPAGASTRADGKSAARVEFDDGALMQALCGSSNSYLKVIERAAAVSLHQRGTEISVEGDAHCVALVIELLEQLYGLLRRGAVLSGDDIVRAIRVLEADGGASLREVFDDTVLVPKAGRPIAPKGLAQKRYVDAVRHHDMVFCVGPAGTGKTFLAMALAVRALLEKDVKRIILTRPAVEAGERLGFLPGTLEEKINPYLRPLYDALHDMLDANRIRRLMDQGVVEVAPLAVMRGRTLNDSFIILDEAQNTTQEQMKMFLTRLGFGSRAVVNGDLSQSDLPSGARSGLRVAVDLLEEVRGIRICRFTEKDVVRHPLVQDIIRAYERAGATTNATQEPRRHGDPGREPQEP